MRTEEVIDWTAVCTFSPKAIDIGQCLWCGDGFVRVRFMGKPWQTCNEVCSRLLHNDRMRERRLNGKLVGDG